MQTEEFVTRVQETEQVTDHDTAERIAVASIETLCIYMSAEQSRRLASQLPAELANAAEAGREQAAGTRAQVPLDDFYTRVAARASMDVDAVRQPARAAIHVLQQAITRGELADVTFDLPPEINTLMAS